ncbi:MAG: glycosyltransferase family 1 protein [Chloroflexi bacterium]|nr:glycosyltransferase family 1 protein [Chloroflexota bacterium]
MGQWQNIRTGLPLFRLVTKLLLMHLAVNAYFWNRPNSGSGQYTRSLVTTLRQMVSDLQITLIYPQVAGDAGLQDVPSGVKVFPAPTRPGYLGKVWFEQWGFPGACTAVHADIAHIPYWGGPLRSPIPQVVTVHDLTTMLVPEYRRKAGARLYNALVAASARGADHIITDSHASKEEIVMHLHIPVEKVSPIHLAVTAVYRPQPNSLLDMAVLRKYDLPDFYVLYLGGYELHKNVTTLLLAWTYVGQALGDEYPLILAGKKPESISDSYPDYDGYIQKLGISDYVRWIGYVDEGDKPSLYRNAETFVFPSRREGFGLPVLEALACGTPVVTTSATSLPEVVGEAGFAVDPDDARGMAGAIIATIVQDDLAKELRATAVTQAAKFSWADTAVQTLHVYDKVFNRSRR